MSHSAGRLRVSLVCAAFALTIASGARLSYAAPSFTVNSTADAPDASPGDGICATAAVACTLRAAIQEANFLNSFGGTTVHVPAATYTLTIAGANEDWAASGDLDLVALNGITIDGAGAASTIIDGNGLDRVFEIRNSATATISNLTIRNGHPSGVNSHGGGVRSAGTLTLMNDCLSTTAGRRRLTRWLPAAPRSTPETPPHRAAGATRARQRISAASTARWTATATAPSGATSVLSNAFQS